MRSFNILGADKQSDPASTGLGNRPEMLRRKSIAHNAYILVVAALMLMPPAIYALVLGVSLPFLLATMVLAGGLVSLTMHQRGQVESSAATQVATLMATGMVLTLADPRLGDAGLAMAVMGPVLAALVARTMLRRMSWLALAPVAVLGVVASLLGLPSAPVADAFLLSCAAGGFAIAFAVVAQSAHRINAAYEVHDKAQISAYRHLIEHVQDAVLRFSPDGSILLASRSSEFLFGCPRYQIVGDKLSDRLHVMDRPSFLTAFADAAEDGRSRTIEVRLRQDDPRARSNVPCFVWAEMQLSPIIEDGARSTRNEVITLIRDISARKDAETAMAEARRVAEDASQAKSRFLATIGHELRTPLNAVVGFSEMMSSGIGGELSPTHKEYAGLIQQSGKHLLEVVGMLLDMSRIEAGKFEIQAEHMDPTEIVPACIAMVDQLAHEQKVQLVSEIEANLPTMTADERVCRQIMINLLSNAIKFSHEGGLVTAAVKRQGQSISFSVRDRGIGMAPAAMARIGEPFFQVQDGLARKYEGTGLGLSIVKGLVELHGGTLRAMSEIGAGTTITVLLPINGPATKPGETADILPLFSEPAAAAPISWPNEKRKAQ
ncbi:PAS domain-containing sensor histidine kinase [Devosia sp. XJ19-1]|uniref:histidine kinase n=1 Tax=Devosia ureilytica TaxID=2952754 RepID=A0A9Q4FTM1_9HYPH|nr:PAS domain-containing sensor histidine kinase [Devosia ureilytica]MCP8884281.1 PAS domain-containing sensor histidine kinase [Devosia ureilytica]MCP8887889.1 PAS domain-containing sensor histidine kinase [Devosia ureilytica]